MKTICKKIKSTFSWLFDLKDWKKVLKSIPSILTLTFVVSVIVMNLMASKTIILTNPSWLGLTGGILFSWIPFLCMSIVTRSFGPKAATKLNILGLITNCICVGMFQLVAAIQWGGDPSTYTAFNQTFSCTWQVFVASSIAFVLSGIVNNCINYGIGKMFRKNPKGVGAYVCRTYISGMVGQFIDNFVFTSLAFLVFFNLSIGSTLGWTLLTAVGAGVFGAIMEVVMEIIFSPIGYRVAKKLDKKEEMESD